MVAATELVPPDPVAVSVTVVSPLRSGMPEINPVEESIDNPDGNPLADHELNVPV